MSLKDIIQNESIEDVLTLLAPNSDYRKLDRLYTYTRFEAITSGELSLTFDELFRKGILQDHNGEIIKDPNWKEPKFVTEQKYDFK